MNEESKRVVYLVEKPGKVMDMLKKVIHERTQYQKRWMDWTKNNLPKGTKLRQSRDGLIVGFGFDEIPEGWRRPDRNGASIP